MATYIIALVAEELIDLNTFDEMYSNSCLVFGYKTLVKRLNLV